MMRRLTCRAPIPYLQETYPAQPRAGFLLYTMREIFRTSKRGNPIAALVLCWPERTGQQRHHQDPATAPGFLFLVVPMRCNSKRQVYMAGVSIGFQQTGCRGAGTHEAVRKRVRTDTKGLGWVNRQRLTRGLTP